MKATVSVIVPVYNVEKYLDRCVNSIVNQSYKNLEIILVDDGSPDNCPQLCDEWASKDSRIKVVHKQNAGLGMARNTGIENATGEFICFFDSDDYIDSSTIEKCVNRLYEKNADAAIFGMVSVDDDGNYLENVNFGFEAKYFEAKEIVDDLLPELIAHDFSKGPAHSYGFSACTALFRLSVIKQNNLRFMSERKIISEDTYFLLELYSKLHAVAVIAEALYFRFVNTASLTQTYRSDRQNKNNLFFAKSLELLNELNYPNEIYIRLIMLYHNFTIAAFKQIMCSDLDNTNKRKLIFSELDNLDLRKTLKYNIIKKHKRTLKFFFLFANFRIYSLCYLMLCLKKQRSSR